MTEFEEKEIWRSHCNHKDPDTDLSTLVEGNNGYCRCIICGTSFNISDIYDIGAELDNLIINMEDLKYKINDSQYAKGCNDVIDYYIEKIKDIRKKCEYPQEDQIEYPQEDQIVVHIRDINGKRDAIIFKNIVSFSGFDWSWYDDENYDILMVEWRNHIVYNSLTDDGICLDDLLGFFR